MFIDQIIGANMASNDQIIGAIIMVISLAAAAVELILLIIMPAVQDVDYLGGFPQAQYWAIVIPLFIGVFGVLGIMAWIGYTMAKTPPPEAWDIEEFEDEFDDDDDDD